MRRFESLSNIDKVHNIVNAAYVYAFNNRTRVSKFRAFTQVFFDAIKGGLE